MINVITNDLPVSVNPYPGMSLAEACGAMEAAVAEVCNDFEMGILLTEHAYLYANGTEMEYVDEAGNLNKDGVSIKEKAINALTRAGEIIMELWDKLSDAVMTKIESLKIAMAKYGIRNADVKRIKDLSYVVFGINSISLKVNYTVDDDFINDNYSDWMNKSSSNSDISSEIYDMYVNTGESTIEITPSVFDKAVDAVMNNRIMSAIKNAKKQANQEIKDEIKRVRSMKPDDMNETIAGLKDSIKTNSKINKALIKVYHAYVNQQIAIVHTVMKSAGGKTAIDVGKKIDDADRKARKHFTRKD